MGNCVFCNKNYRIIKMNDKSFLVINKNKEFIKGHTHVPNFNLAKIIIYCCLEGKFPSKSTHLENNKRVLTSILRVCTHKYERKFRDMLNKLEE